MQVKHVFWGLRLRKNIWNSNHDNIRIYVISNNKHLSAKLPYKYKHTQHNPASSYLPSSSAQPLSSVRTCCHLVHLLILGSSLGESSLGCLDSKYLSSDVHLSHNQAFWLVTCQRSVSPIGEECQGVHLSWVQHRWFNSLVKLLCASVYILFISETWLNDSWLSSQTPLPLRNISKISF